MARVGPGLLPGSLMRGVKRIQSNLRSLQCTLPKRWEYRDQWGHHASVPEWGVETKIVVGEQEGSHQ